MEKNYINTSEAKSLNYANKLENSPIDKHKAKYGEFDQANYLLKSK